jgi:diguanylate cyclase (GGDEF)-like protein
MGVAVPDRGRVWLLVNATPLWRGGVLDQVYASFEDITERVLLSKELHLQASTDYLTGVANRRSLMERLQREFERCRRHPAQRCAVLSIDLDHFKHVNDHWGHATGDAVLQHVARLMQQTTRQNDLVARSGGEEFTLLLPDTGPEEALALAERLRERIESRPVLANGQPVAITLSVGVSLIRPTDLQLDDVLARADQALYLAKDAGRNAVRAHTG